MSNPDTDGDRETTGFPYECLPNEMRIEILENIHDPQDKLNIVEALPSTEWLMDWDHTCLQFELVYPLVVRYLQCPYERKDRSWKNLLNLCIVSPSFQRIVTSHFEKYITWNHDSAYQYFDNRKVSKNSELSYYQFWTTSPLPYIQAAASDRDTTSPPWNTTLPFGIITCLIERTQIPFLTELGTKVWSLEIAYMNGYLDGRNIEYLVKCLRLAPNLRRLNLKEIFILEFGLHGLPPEVLEAEHQKLPELPYLKMISLEGNCPKVQQWILPRYTGQLEVMKFQDCYLTDNFNPSCFPKLESIDVNFTQTERMEYRDASIVKVNDLFNKLLLSPLKVISVQVDEVDVRNFFNFMLTLNHFGKTLHTLEMKFGRMNGEMGVEVKNELRGWISQLKFPKLSCLRLICYVGPLEFLLKMSALKKLCIVTSSLEPLQLSNVKGLRFVIKKNAMLESPMWQLFPKLEWIRMDTAVYQQYSPIPLHRYIYVSRECYEKHQRSKKN